MEVIDFYMYPCIECALTQFHMDSVLLGAADWLHFDPNVNLLAVAGPQTRCLPSYAVLPPLLKEFGSLPLASQYRTCRHRLALLSMWRLTGRLSEHPPLVDARKEDDEKVKHVMAKCNYSLLFC